MATGGRFLILLSPVSPFLHPRSVSIIRLSGHRLLPSAFLQRRRFSPPIQTYPATSSADSALVPAQPRHRRFHTRCVGRISSEPLVRAPPHPWPEFSQLVDNLTAAGYSASSSSFNYNELVGDSSLPEEFLRATSVCLAFARDRANDLGALSKSEIEVVVRNGHPFLFKNGEESARRMRLFLGAVQSNALDSEEANMVDLMRFLLSYASSTDTSSETNNLHIREPVASSVRNLFDELVKLGCTSTAPSCPGFAKTVLTNRYGEAPSSFRENVKMKRGDWICTRCNFMNFAKNAKCLECEEMRPKKLLTGGEWGCPQCDFLNYGRNTVCLRCDCKRPGDLSLGNTGYQLGSKYGSGSNSNKEELEQRLAANEEKAKRWFSKISQMENASDMSSAIADEDFPEIMPLRKGVNRFVVSTKKTPLERRLGNAQYQENMRSDFSAGGIKDLEENKASRSLDEILGHSSAASKSSDTRSTAGLYSGQGNSQASASSANPPSAQRQGTNSNYVPFVPLPPDMFAKQSGTSKQEESRKASADGNSSVAFGRSKSTASSMGNEFYDSGTGQHPSDLNLSQNESSNQEKEQAEKTGRWFERIAELDDDTDAANSIPDDGFPERMPMRKGENRFVVSRKKDRSLTSPMYKRRMALEQANETNNYVPFVPFPPGYFARKDEQQPQGTDSPKVDNTSTSVGLGNLADRSVDVSSRDSSAAMQSQMEVVEQQTTLSTNLNNGLQASSYSSLSSEGCVSEGKTEKRDFAGSSEGSEGQNRRSSWSGKSLEGSAVKEADPLDMSEEAKAERWFQRVAQIKDISELSQIPDEDFPSIMPMRKGVNRFVVSKRKTPLERRLTSQQYRRNLPIINSEPLKREDENNSN